MTAWRVRRKRKVPPRSSFAQNNWKPVWAKLAALNPGETYMITKRQIEHAWFYAATVKAWARRRGVSLVIVRHGERALAVTRQADDPQPHP